MIILKGIQFGIVLAFLVGPVFFAIIQTSAERGFAKGALVALGVSLSDLIYVVVCYLGLIQLIESPHFRQQMAYVGGGILIVFGLYHLLIKSRKSMTRRGAVTAESKSYRFVLKGFFMNAFSPIVPLLWIGYISVASIDLKLVKDSDFAIFFGSMLLTVLATDLAKAYLGGRLANFITPKRMMWMNVIVGVVLIGYGIRLILQNVA